MNLEARSVSAVQREQFMERLRGYKLELRDHREGWKKARSAVYGSARSRAELLDGGLSGEGASQDHRSRLLRGTDKLNKTSERLQEARRVAAETEGVGEGILSELGRQREVIVHASSTLDVAQDNIGRSKRILVAMGRRLVTNKLIVIGLILFLAAFIVLVICIKFVPSSFWASIPAMLRGGEDDSSNASDSISSDSGSA